MKKNFRILKFLNYFLLKIFTILTSKFKFSQNEALQAQLSWSIAKFSIIFTNTDTHAHTCRMSFSNTLERSEKTGSSASSLQSTLKPRRSNKFAQFSLFTSQNIIFHSLKLIFGLFIFFFWFVGKLLKRKIFECKKKTNFRKSFFLHNKSESKLFEKFSWVLEKSADFGFWNFFFCFSEIF